MASPFPLEAICTSSTFHRNLFRLHEGTRILSRSIVIKFTNPSSDLADTSLPYSTTELKGKPNHIGKVHPTPPANSFAHILFSFASNSVRSSLASPPVWNFILHDTLMALHEKCPTIHQDPPQCLHAKSPQLNPPYQ